MCDGVSTRECKNLQHAVGAVASSMKNNVDKRMQPRRIRKVPAATSKRTAWWYLVVIEAQNTMLLGVSPMWPKEPSFVLPETSDGEIGRAQWDILK